MENGIVGLDPDLLDFAEEEGKRQERSVVETLSALGRGANTLLGIQLVFLGAAVGYTVDLLSSGGLSPLAAGGAGLALWVAAVAAWTTSKCLRHADWFPEGTEPQNVLIEGYTAAEVRRVQLDRVSEKLAANKARTVELADALNAARQWTLLAPLGYPAGWIVGLLIASSGA
ncbi:MAG: hypothetical protein AAF170_14650 [Bacteroidota bacterium]